MSSAPGNEATNPESTALSPTAVQPSIATRNTTPWSLLAFALLLVAAGWALVRVTIVQGPGVYEARFLASQAAAALALLIGTLFLGQGSVVPSGGNLPAGAPSSRMWSPFLYLLPTPFAALILLPYGLRSLAPVALVLAICAAGINLWNAWKMAGTGRNLTVDISTVLATTALAFALEPVRLIAGSLIAGHSASSRFELLACAAAVGVGASLLRRWWGLGSLLATTAAIVLGGLDWFVPAALLATAALESLISGPANHRRGRLILAALLLLIACALSWVGLLIPMAAWARGPRRGWFAVLVVLGGALAMALPSQAWSQVARGLLILTLLFPLAVVTMLRNPRGEDSQGLRNLQFSSAGLWRLMTGLAMTAVALRTLEPHLALIPAALLWSAPAALLRSAPAQKASPEVDLLPGKDSEGVSGSTLWIALWLAAVALAAGYPWLRPTPLLQQFDAAQRLARVTDRTHILTLGLCVALAVGVALLRSFLSPARRRHLAAPMIAAVLLPAVLFALWGVAPRSVSTVHRWPPKVLTEATPSAVFPLRQALDNQGGLPMNAEVYIDSFLANATAVVPGTTVAQIVLTSVALTSIGPTSSGKAGINTHLGSAQLTAGTDTGEWRATNSADKPGNALAIAPLPFSYWWTDDDPPNLGQRFRARLTLKPSQPRSSPQPAANVGSPSIVIQRNPGLPANVQLRIDRVALARTTRATP